MSRLKQSVNPDVAAVVLAGGRATRMQGVDKGLVELSGKPLIAYVLDAVNAQVAETIISANRNQSKYAALGARAVADTIGDFAGPLAGIAAGMHSAGRNYLFVCPCDSPFIGDDVVKRLHTRLSAENADIAVAHDGERPQPVFALMRCDLLSSLLDFLQRGERKIMFWYRQHKLVNVDFSDQPDTFININTAKEIARAEQRLSGIREQKT